MGIEEKLDKITGLLEEVLEGQKNIEAPCKDEWLSTNEVADIIGKSVAHVHALKAKGVLKRHPLGFLKSEVMAGN